MAFNTVYPVGGTIDEIKKINFPEHVFPTLFEPGMQGFEIDVPAAKGVYQEQFLATHDIELTDVAIACSGYGKGDYWELEVGGKKLYKTIYTKELPQHVNVGTAIFTVYKVPAGTPILLQFNNTSGTSKTVWFDLRFLQ